MSRREFLRRSAATTLGLTGLSAVLAACRERAPAGGAAAPTVGLASPDNPVTLPLYDDLPPIEDGLSPEPGPLRIFNWNDYIYKKVLKAFEAEYGVEIEYTQFSGMNEAIAKVQNDTVRFDLFFPTIENLPKLVAAKKIQPLNHSYIPNLRNVWPRLRDPWYDRGSRYSVPYMTWKTGIGYRRDHVDDPGRLPMPFDIYWDARWRGRVNLLDEYRETIGMALIRIGVGDMNTHDEEAIRRAGEALSQLNDLVDVKVAAGDYQKLAEGEAWLTYSWSGNMNYAQYYLPKGVGPEVLGFYYPPDGGWEVTNDLIVISARAENPVLAHRFIDFLLDIDNGLTNFGYEGYQPPFVGVSEERWLEAGNIPGTLRTTLVTERDFERGQPILALPPEVDQVYQDVWTAFKAGV
ncbi:MAG TPA: spermidine/putrescine ABC transporter substrate-binding protein [Actinomycetota bacterium]|nr:spermidine/putrescine ABC transporter substrate-binding protein [Actinomycetota bacterium]